MKPAEGIALGDRYRLVSRIAVGGMGEVWVAHDESLARDVAVKVLREEFAGDEGFLERFRTEARNSAQLSHPNIAQLYDYGEQDGSGFLVMELILGEPLADLLDREPVLPTRRLLPILAETARALHAAHVAGVVHRDVKPGNILLARSGRVKITDFGISTATGRIPMTDSGMVMGTAQYLSPEQAIGKAATPASDIYALGIVAYEALVGNRPFTGPTAVDIAVAHVNLPVPPLPPEIEPTLAALVMRMLAKDPEERPRSAASLARVLDEMVERTPPTGMPSVLGRHARLADVVDAVESGAADAASGTFPGIGGVPPLPPEENPATLLARRATDTAGQGVAEPGADEQAEHGAARAGTPAGGTAGPSGPMSWTPDAGGSVAGGPPAATAPPTPARGVPERDVPDAGPATPYRVPTPAGGLGPAGAVVPGTAGGAPVPTGRPTSGPVPRQAPVTTRPTTAGQAPSTPAAGPATGRKAGAGEALRDAVRSVGHWLGFVAQGVNRPLPAGTTTGKRFGRLSWPLVVLVLMVLFALLGAAFADRLWGPSRAAPAPHDAGSDIVTTACSVAGCDRGIIGPGSGLLITTTARDT